MCMKRYLCLTLACLLGTLCCFAQSERAGVRRGNRDFRKEHWPQAEIHYKKALVAELVPSAASEKPATGIRLRSLPSAWISAMRRMT